MSSRAPVELDFLGLRATAAAGEHHSRSSSSSSSSIRGMETSAIARIDPQLLRRVIARPPPPAAASTAPLTLFYNGSVAVFDVSHDKAKAIMRMATTTEGRGSGNTLVGNFAKDMPLARTKSLHRFLQKRKESYHPIPMVFSKGEGSQILDPEGNKYIDFLSAYSAVNQVLFPPPRRPCLTRPLSI